MRSLCILQSYFCTERSILDGDAHFPSVCEIAEMNEKTIKAGMEEHDVVIHATKCGMHPHCNETIVDPALFSSHKVCDVVYVPIETKLLQDARAKGMPDS